MRPTDPALAEVIRVEGRRVLATLTRTLGRLDLAEDAVQDASLIALEAWPRTGVPDVPRAWLTTVARRCAIDRLRRERVRMGKERTAGMDHLDDPPGSDDAQASVVRDDLLRLVFTCCHPALSIEARVALSLRTLVGLEVGEVAALLLVSESSMARRLVRARRKVVDARIPYRVPEVHATPARSAGICPEHRCPGPSAPVSVSPRAPPGYTTRKTPPRRTRSSISARSRGHR